MLIAALMAMAIDAPAAGGGDSPAASGTLEMFKALCVSSEARSEETIRQADALKWFAPTPEAMANLPPMIKLMTNLQVRMVRQADNSGFVLMTGNGVDLLSTGKPPPNATCMVMGINPGDADRAIKPQTSAWLGAQPVLGAGSMQVYAFTEANGARAFMTSVEDREAREAFDSGKLKIVALDVEPTESLLIYIVPTQAK
jgi:hypothetical protein